MGAALERPDLELTVSEAARRASTQDGKSPIDHVLSDGEDFELLLALSGDVNDSPVALHRIGQVAERNVVLQDSSGDSVAPIEAMGYVH